MAEESVFKKDVHAERIFITAAMAREFLKKNIENNRPINSERVEKYAREMKSGKWHENGDTIKFTGGNVLIDGQHRLLACAQCGIGFWSLVAYGLKREAMLTIDRNQTRSVAQVLNMTYDVPDHNAVAGALTWLWRFREGIVLATRHPTAGESADLLSKHPGIRESVADARRVIKRFKAGPLSIVAFCHYAFGCHDQALRDLFFDALAHGVGLRDTDPVFQLRERMIQSATSSKGRIQAHEACALYFKAWNAEREQRPCKVLRWMSTEQFPNIGPLETDAKSAESTVKLKKKA